MLSFSGVMLARRHVSEAMMDPTSTRFVRSGLSDELLKMGCYIYFKTRGLLIYEARTCYLQKIPPKSRLELDTSAKDLANVALW
jgi:hypothetical protein